jgi:rubrerythrin
MFDIEKAKSKGIDARTIEILQSVNENTAKREACTLHEFEPTDSSPFNTSCYLCDGCGYLAHAIGNEEFLCPDCGGTGKKTEKPKHQSID